MQTRCMDVSRPLDIVHKSLNKQVEITLKDGRCLKGELLGYDTDLNLSLGNAEMVSEKVTKKLGTVVIRKNNVRDFTPMERL